MPQNALPPPPINDKPGSFAWLEWYRQLRNYVSTSGSVPWYIINFAGSNITDIAVREHNSMQNTQGGTAGEKYHLTSAQLSNVNNIPNLQTDVSDITTALAAGYTGTVTIAKLTAGGVDGTLTFTNGILTNVVPAT